jgi:membrane-bound lytic murein transglycosylase A
MMSHMVSFLVEALTDTLRRRTAPRCLKSLDSGLRRNDGGVVFQSSPAEGMCVAPVAERDSRRRGILFASPRVAGLRSAICTAGRRARGIQFARPGVAGSALAVALALSACVSAPPPAPPAPALKTITTARYLPAAPSALPALNDADLLAAWPALLASCRVLERRAPAWRTPCAAALLTNATDAAALRAALAAQFDAYQIIAESRVDEGNQGRNGRLIEATERGRITGYYEPLLAGSRRAEPPYTVPLYRVPDDLLAIELGDVYPDLRGRRLRGRLVDTPQGRKVLPYWSRGEIDSAAKLRGHELIFVDDAIEAFFLQIQGSGRVQLPDGSIVRVGYADSNGHPYESIGRLLVERGELPLAQASMQGIQSWARANPQRVAELLAQNPSYVFFRELPLGDPAAGPIGALGIALTPGYSVAVDPQFVPLGAPLVLATTHPATNAPLTRLMLAQDTGGAIRGPVRFDFFWGFGRPAAEIAGRQRHDAAAWILVPRGVRPEALLGVR